MSKLTIKSGCVEAVFKRGRGRTKGIEQTKPLKSEQSTTTPETPLRESEPANLQQMTQSKDEGTSSGAIPTT